MLKITNLVKKYGGFRALNNVSFELEEGRAAALLGPNGAGKSTLIKSILGLLEYSGEIEVDGEDIKKNVKGSKSKISYVPQEPALYDSSVTDILGFFARMRKADIGRANDVLRQVNLFEHKDKLTSELSGGMKQRLSFAIALLSDAKLLILDEPTSNLDSQSRIEILDLIKELKLCGHTILFSSHRVDEVVQIADNVISMKDGEIVDIYDIDYQMAAGGGSSVHLVLNFENGLTELASKVLSKEGFDNLRVENNSIFIEVKNYEKIVPIQKLLSEEIIIKDFYIDEGDLN